jgi:hypothetical protein
MIVLEGNGARDGSRRRPKQDVYRALEFHGEPPDGRVAFRWRHALLITVLIFLKICSLVSSGQIRFAPDDAYMFYRYALTRVESSIHPDAKVTTTAGATNSPKPTKTAVRATRHPDHGRFRTRAATPASLANTPSNAVSPHSGVNLNLASDPGDKSARPQPTAHNSDSRTNPPIGGHLRPSRARSPESFSIFPKLQWNLGRICARGAASPTFQLQQGVSLLWRFPPPNCVRA